MSAIQNLRETKTANIASGQSITSAIDLEGYRLAAVRTSVAWPTSAPMTFQCSMDNSSYLDILNASGAQVQITSAAFSSLSAAAITFDSALSEAVSVHRWLRLRAGLSSAPVNATGAVTLTCVLVPYR